MPNDTRKFYKLPEHLSTFQGLHDWHKSLFKRLGWIVLAEAKGMKYKVSEYKKCVNHLISSIKDLSKKYSDIDRKHDLHVLLLQAECLKSKVLKMF
jgi:hypothetical protein